MLTGERELTDREWTALWAIAGPLIAALGPAQERPSDEALTGAMFAALARYTRARELFSGSTSPVAWNDDAPRGYFILQGRVDENGRWLFVERWPSERH